MVKDILKLIGIGAEIFQDERKNYFLKKVEAKHKKIQQVEDSDFYSKDMEAKGKAEREIESEVHELKLEFYKEYGNK